MRPALALAFAIALYLTGLQSAQAGDPRNGFGLDVGGGYSLGLVGAASSGIGPSYSFGVHWRPNDFAGYALRFSGFGGTDTTSGSLAATTAFTEVALYGSAYFRKKFYLGLNTGLQSQTLTTTTFQTGTVIGSGFSIGPHLGWVHDLEDGFTFSSEFSVRTSIGSSMVLWMSLLFRLGYTI